MKYVIESKWNIVNTFKDGRVVKAGGIRYIGNGHDGKEIANFYQLDEQFYFPDEESALKTIAELEASDAKMGGHYMGRTKKMLYPDVVSDHLTRAFRCVSADEAKKASHDYRLKEVMQRRRWYSEEDAEEQLRMEDEYYAEHRHPLR